MSKDSITPWYLSSIALLFFILPVLLADELSLLANWLLIFSCWLLVVLLCAYQAIKPDKA